jgi:hypothetical protein
MDTDHQVDELLTLQEELARQEAPQPILEAAQILIMYWAGNHTCGPERGYVMSA